MLTSSYTSKSFNQHPAVQAWISKITDELPVAFCLRWTHECTRHRSLFNETSCSRDIGWFWNGMDRALYGKEWKTRKLKRLVVLEHTDGANWHVHGLCSTDRYATNKIRVMLREQWKKHIGIEDSNAYTHKHFFLGRAEQGQVC